MLLGEIFLANALRTPSGAVECWRGDGWVEALAGGGKYVRMTKHGVELSGWSNPGGLTSYVRTPEQACALLVQAMMGTDRVMEVGGVIWGTRQQLFEYRDRTRRWFPIKTCPRTGMSIGRVR